MQFSVFLCVVFFFVVSWRSRKDAILRPFFFSLFRVKLKRRNDAILRLFVISSFHPEITKRRILSLFRGEKTINSKLLVLILSDCILCIYMDKDK